MKSIDAMFDEAEGTPAAGNLDSMFDAAEKEAGPTYSPALRSSLTPIREVDREIRVGEPRLFPQNQIIPEPPRPPAADATAHPMFNQTPDPVPAPPPDGFFGQAGRALLPSALGQKQPQPIMAPTGEGTYEPQAVQTFGGGPLDVAGDIAGAGVRALGTSLDPILPWDVRGQREDGTQKNWLEGLQNPDAGLAKPAREALAERIGQAWEKATDEERPYIERAGHALLAEIGAVGFLGAATVEDPFAMAPIAAGTKAFKGASDLAGRGLQKVGKDQMYRVIKPGIPHERKGFEVETIFDEDVGGNPEQVYQKSKAKLNELNAELKARIQEGADEGHRVDMWKAIDDAVADVVQNPGGSADNVAMLDDMDRVLARMKARARRISRQSKNQDGNLDLLEAQAFKQELGHRGAWRHIAEKRGIPLSSKETAESMLSEKVYNHLNKTIDDLAPAGVRDVNRRMSKLIPVNQAAGHRMVIEGRKDVVGVKDLLGTVAVAANPKLWPVLALNRATSSGRVANAIHKLGTKLRTATTSAEKARYVAALKKLGVTDEEIKSGTHLIDESAGSADAYKGQDLRVEEPPEAMPETPDNVVPFRKQGEPPLPPKRRTLPQEESDPNTLYQEEGTNLPAKVEPEANVVGPIFYSGLRKKAPDIIKKAGGKMRPQDFLAAIKKPESGIKRDEIKWTGLEEYLKERAAGKKPQYHQPALEENSHASRVAVEKRKQELLDEMEGIEKESELKDADSETQARWTALREEYEYIEKNGKLRSAPTPEPSPDKTPITTQEIQNFLDENEVEIIEHHKFQDKKNTKWHSRTIDKDLGTEGQNDYRELLLVWKRKPTTQRLLGIPEGTAFYNKTHWNEADHVVHLRYSTKKTPDGKKVLFLDEIQGDWGQTGRKQGYLGQKPIDEKDLAAHQETLKDIPNDGSQDELRLNKEKQAARLEERIGGGRYDTPSAPFVKETDKWVGLGLKRMLRHAAEEGYDYMVWTTGEQQANRAAQMVTSRIDHMTYRKTEDGKYVVEAVDKYGGVVRHEQIADLNNGPVSRFRLTDIIGEELVDRIDTRVAGGETAGKLDASDFALGGQGMKGFYDVMVPKTLKAYLQKYLKKNWGEGIEEVPVELHKRPPQKKERYRDNETPDGRFRIEERTISGRDAGREPQYYLRDRRGNDLDGPFDSEEDALDSEYWPRVPNDDEYYVDAVKMDADDVNARYIVEEQDGRWYIVDNNNPREPLVPREQESLLDERDTRDRGSRYSGEHTHQPYPDMYERRRTEDGFDSEEEAKEILSELREEEDVDHPKYYVMENDRNREVDGPFDTEREAEEAMPTMRDERAAGVEEDYGEDETYYTVVDEDGHQVVDDVFYEGDENAARRAMMEHWEENRADQPLAIESSDGTKLTIKQQGVRITDAMKKSVLEGQELFLQKQRGAVKGQIQKKRLNSVITLFKGRADATTWMHEHGHWLRSEVLNPKQSEAVLKWAGQKTWTREAEEKFARGLERYLYDGKAPSKSLEEPFATMRKAFQEVYKDARGTEIGEEIPQAMKLVYDAIFLRGQRLRNAEKVARLLRAARRAGMSSPRIIPLIKREIEGGQNQRKEREYETP